MTMRNGKLLALLFAVVCAGTMCREIRVDSPTGSTERTSSEQREQTTVASVEERTLSAIDAANDRVESARILSLPLTPLTDGIVRGMALPTYAELPGLTYDDMLRRVAGVGATHVSIVASWNQQTIFHNRIAPDPHKTPPDERVGEMIDAAHRLGLKTLVFPIIHVERRNTGEWRGKLAPTKIDRWRREYRAFILHYAELAAEHDADVLSVGSELSSQEGATDWWRSLIADVRARYDGELLYSANWDHYRHPHFWGDLDYIGVSSYFEVAQRTDEPIFKVTERWLEHRRDLLDFAAAQGRPLILTEVGYPSVDTAATKPWDYTRRTPPNPNAQLAAFRSLTDAWSLPVEENGDGFGGLFIWHGWGRGGVEDASYPIWGKASEHLVRRWYGADQELSNH